MIYATLIAIAIGLYCGWRRYRQGRRLGAAAARGAGALDGAGVAVLLLLALLAWFGSSKALAPVARAVHTYCTKAAEAPAGGTRRAASGMPSGGSWAELGLPLRPKPPRAGSVRLAVRFHEPPRGRDGPLYLRTMAFDEFDGNTWRCTRQMLDASDSGDGEGWVRLLPGRWDVEADVAMVGGAEGGFPTLCEPLAVRSAGLIVSEGCIFLMGSHGSTGLVMRQRARWAGGREMETLGIIPDRDEPEYRDLPSGPGGDAVRRWVAESGAAEMDEGRRLDALVRHVRATWQYSLTVTNLSRLPPLVNLIEREHRGDCLLLASAMTLALRASGFPARLSVGYACAPESGGERIVTLNGEDAHAWCEVKAAGKGWVLVDPSRLVSATALSGRHGDRLEPPDFATLRDAAGRRVQPEARLAAGSAPTLVVPCLVLAGALAVLLLRSRRRRGGAVNAVGVDRDRAHVLELLERLSRSWGVPWVRSRPLRDQLRLLREAGLAGASLDGAADYLYATEYDSAPRDRHQERRIRKELRRMLRDSSGRNRTTPAEPAKPASGPDT